MSSSRQFMHRGPISPRVHGALDYPLAVVLIAGPLVLNFGDNTAKVFVLVVGVAAALLAVGFASLADAPSDDADVLDVSSRRG